MATLLNIYNQLSAAYGPLQWWPADSPFEVAIGAILTQNTNWKNVEQAIANLRADNALTPDAIAALSRPHLERLIRPSGFFRQKAERLHLLVAHLHTHHQGTIEQLLQQPLSVARAELLSLKGIGPETADSILLYAGNHPSFVVDAYTKRLFERLGILQSGEGYDQIRTLFMESIAEDPEIYNEYHALIVEHCKRYCRKKPLCSDCPLRARCTFPSQSPQEHKKP
ncbi:MAG: endonuclease [Desulfuromonas sp.]|nr:MAG: endonuclease [Desulfuromonas sp.]